MGLEEILASAEFNAFIDALVVFFIAFITELLVAGGMPTVHQLYIALLVGALSGLVFYAKKRKLEYPMNGR